MAANLNPEQLALLQSWYSAPQSGSGYQDLNSLQLRGQDASGNYFNAIYGGHAPGGEAGWESNGYTPAQQYTQDVVPGRHSNGDQIHNYDANGNFTRTSTLDDSSMRDFLTALTLAAGPLATGGVFGGAAGAGGGMTNGAFLGEAPWAATPGGALDFGAAGGVGAAASGGGGMATMDALPLMNAAPTGVEDLFTIGTSGGGLFGKGVGAAASLAGGLLGSKPQESQSTATRDIPEWLKPYITGDGGVLSQTMQQLNASRSPERMAEWARLRGVGMDMANQPIAGNPFANGYTGGGRF